MRQTLRFLFLLFTLINLGCSSAKNSAANQRNPTSLANEILELLNEKNNKAQVKFTEDANKLMNSYVTEFAKSTICINGKLTNVQVMEVKNYFLEFEEELIKKSTNYEITKDGIREVANYGIMGRASRQISKLAELAWDKIFN